MKPASDPPLIPQRGSVVGQVMIDDRMIQVPRLSRKPGQQRNEQGTRNKTTISAYNVPLLDDSLQVLQDIAATEHTGSGDRSASFFRPHFVKLDSFVTGCHYDALVNNLRASPHSLSLSKHARVSNSMQRTQIFLPGNGCNLGAFRPTENRNPVRMLWMGISKCCSYFSFGIRPNQGRNLSCHSN